MDKASLQADWLGIFGRFWGSGFFFVLSFFFFFFFLGGGGGVGEDFGVSGCLVLGFTVGFRGLGCTVLGLRESCSSLLMRGCALHNRDVTAMSYVGTMKLGCPE